MVHTNPEFEISNLTLDFEFDQHLGSHKHVINIIMWFRDMGCYTSRLQVKVLTLLPHRCRGHLHLEGKSCPGECLRGWHHSDLLPRQQR
jgi:hypothetical protein